MQPLTVLGALSLALLGVSAHSPTSEWHTIHMPTFTLSYPAGYASDRFAGGSPRHLVLLHDHHPFHNHHHLFHHHHHHQQQQLPPAQVHPSGGVHVTQTVIGQQRQRKVSPPEYGSHLFSTPWAQIIRFSRSAQPHRNQRAGRARRALEAVRLIGDPRLRVDVPRTLENVGKATRRVLEHENSPVCHVRNALGSARDVLFSFARMSPTGLLVPTSHRVAEVGESEPFVGWQVEDDRDGEDQHRDTLDAVTGLLRGGVRAAKDSVRHGWDAVHSTRRALVSTRLHGPGLLVPYLRSIELHPRRGTGPALGSTASSARHHFHQEEPDSRRLVGAGRLLDLLMAAANRPFTVGLPPPEHFHVINSDKQSLGSTSNQDFMEKMRVNRDRRREPSSRKDAIGRALFKLRSSHDVETPTASDETVYHC